MSSKVTSVAPVAFYDPAARTLEQFATASLVNVVTNCNCFAAWLPSR